MGGFVVAILMHEPLFQPVLQPRNQTQHNSRKDTVMKTKHMILGRINVLQQSTWMRPSLMMWALIVAALGVAGCHTNH
ncbi:MAG: hypothetical protein B7Z55_00010 [Planctomycetales bacterium 12-60-4]|nr:MAG: hypothetical protein B7Z55_00010 [Planctomycetales bacterium 12-60-4]